MLTSFEYTRKSIYKQTAIKLKPLNEFKTVGEEEEEEKREKEKDPLKREMLSSSG